ncbi:PIG-L family deacetylase [Clostridium sp. AM58-1XD]|uniref:PIG-L deacetylase family protein n=1 Tax=Clostridium sp. AM58-1XD TaxID=2292307 RepID=UPI000E4C51D9|nr:PIG-L family deacetylase [Clostridium sp. AM58-1XD]RGZ00380.1 PIG-L family deacetylase [Clostridium sp. AM58-1XD]
MNKKMMVVSAHAADWCTRAGGTIRRMIEEGWEAYVLALTFGEHGESGAYWKANPDSSFEACKVCRKQEAECAAASLGIKSIEFCDYGDYPLEMHEKEIRSLTKKILDYRPSVILTHWICDPVNLDHEVTGKAVISAVNAAGMTGAVPGARPMSFLISFSLKQPCPIPSSASLKWTPISI